MLKYTVEKKKMERESERKKKIFAYEPPEALSKSFTLPGPGSALDIRSILDKLQT